VVNRGTIVLAASLLSACAEWAAHESWEQGSSAFAAAFARTGDVACTEEPLCGIAVRSLARVPPGTPRYRDATALLARIRTARAAAAAAPTAGRPGAPPAHPDADLLCEGPPATPGDRAGVALASVRAAEALPGRGAKAGSGAVTPPRGLAGGAAHVEPARGVRSAQQEAPPSTAPEPPAPEGMAPPGPQSPGWATGGEGYLAAVEELQRGGRPLVLYFCTREVEHCAMLDRVLDDARVRQVLRRAGRVRVDTEAGAPELALARRYGVTGYPTLLVVRGEGDPVRIHPFTSDPLGAPQVQNAEDFAQVLRRALRDPG
jgi:hypothetical protein